ncbi:hypothetical protein LTR94_032204, partial [Friedmanniomyces endolithicus]
ADLRQLLADAELRAAERLHGNAPCAEIMSRDVIHVPASQAMAQVRALMQNRELLSLPVLDDAGRVQGIIGALDLTRDGESAGDIARRVQTGRPGLLLGVRERGGDYVVRWEYPGGRVSDIQVDGQSGR